MARYRPTSKSLKASISDGKAHAVMLGAGETYLGAFAIFLGATTMQIGVLATLPLLLGSLSQRLGVWIMERFRHRRELITIGAGVQSLMWIGIIAVPFIIGVERHVVSLVILFFSFYHIMAGIVAPSWNSLIGDLVPERERGRFFGLRTQRTSVITFLSLIIAGSLVGLMERTGLSIWGFVLVFSVAFLARMMSAAWLMRHDNPLYTVPDEERVSFFKFLRTVSESNYAKFAIFLAAMNFGIAFANPYFMPYILRDIGLSYIKFTGLLSMLVVVQVLTLKNWGSLSDHYGYKKIISFCTWGITAIPFLWLISGELWYLIIIKAFAGMMWAGYNLASANFLFDAVAPSRRGRCAAYLGIIVGVATFSGSMAGGALASLLPASFTLSTLDGSVSSPFLLIFLISGILRIIAASTLLNTFEEVKAVQPANYRQVFVRVANVRPSSGLRIIGIASPFQNRKKQRLVNIKKIRHRRKKMHRQEGQEEVAA